MQRKRDALSKSESGTTSEGCSEVLVSNENGGDSHSISSLRAEGTGARRRRTGSLRRSLNDALKIELRLCGCWKEGKPEAALKGCQAAFTGSAGFKMYRCTDIKERQCHIEGVTSLSEKPHILNARRPDCRGQVFPSQQKFAEDVCLDVRNPDSGCSAHHPITSTLVPSQFASSC
eukprot:scaffold218541_cov17-Tisochrysis_lutea.AAC.3